MAGILGLLISGAGLIKDQYFNLVSLLLPGNGTNGAQNNTFLDSSTNNFTITRNGNTTQGTFSPFSQTGWGNYFNGSSYLSSPGFNFSTSDFTIECFINTSSLTAGPQPISGYTTTGLNYTITIETGGVFKFYLSSNGSSWDIASGVVLGTATVGKWHHIVIVRSGNSIRGYFDGTGGTTTTSSAAIYNNSTAFYIGAAGSAGANITGYFSNVRVLLGTAAYNPASSTITVPTAPFATGTTNQVLLTCQANRFIDSNTATTAKTITVNGSPSVVAFSPFAPTAAYTTAAMGGSGYFDGTGDYLSVADNTALDMEASDFTMEAWIYPTASFSANGALFSKRASNAVFGGVLVLFGGSNAPTFRATSTNSSWDLVNSTSSVSVVPSQWNHVAIARSGGNWALWVNGNRGVSATGATGTVSNNTAAFGIGANADGSESFPIPVYVAAARVVKGTAVYDPTSSTIPIPTSPLTAITNTSLLLNFTNAGITDATAKNDLETVGNAQISTSVSKFGGGSIAFDGNNDSLNGPSSTELDMGTGNWTVEGWINITTRTLNYPLIIGNNNGTFSAGAVAFTASNADSASYNDRFNLAIFDLGVTKLIPATGTANATGTWYHFAVVRNGTNISIYRDGVSVASATVSASLTINWGKGGVRVGGNNWDGAQSYLNGYIDDLRITKGYARYVTGTGANAGQMVFNGTNTLALPTAPFALQ